VEVQTAGGRSIEIPEGARRLLTSLAWNPNDLVFDDTAVDRIWDSPWPQHPRQTLYTHAARLRKALREAAGGEEQPITVCRRRGGYLLSCEQTAIDLFDFRGMVQRARAHERNGEPDRAIHLYDEALALWRGAPLSGLQTAWADSARAALGHEYRAAIVNLVSLALEQNSCDDYLPVLHRFSADHPLDERIAGLLMVTLYRSGRQDEALNCFQAIRQQMIARLGDEPGPELRTLHARILKRDVVLRTREFSPAG
jgi:DNA-binding SARP family transcriptional activator